MSPPPGKDIVEGRYQNEADFAHFAKSDAIVFGTPTYMGGPAAQFKGFADAADMVWFQQGWKNKLVGGFKHSSPPNGDKGTTLHYSLHYSPRKAACSGWARASCPPPSRARPMA